MSKVDAFQRHATDLFFDPLPPSFPVASTVATDAPADPTAVNADGPILMEMECVLTELCGASGLRPRSSPATTGTTPVSATTPFEVPSATIFVAPQVFVEMPTRRYLHVTQATTLNYSYGHQNPILESCLQSGSTNTTVTNSGPYPGLASFRPTLHAPVFGNTAASSPATPAPTATPQSAQEQARAEEEISGRLPREVLHINKRLDKQQESIDKMQGDMTTLMAMVNQISVSLSNQPERTPTPSVGFALSPGSTPMSSSASSVSSSATPSVAREMFGEMPQSYGFHNLNRQSVILADGTKRSYFTLPADYPLPQATPPMSPSAAENVGGMAPLSVAAQAAGLAPVLCSTANNTAGSESMLVHYVQLPAVVQDEHNGLEEMPEYHVYEAEQIDNEQHPKYAGSSATGFSECEWLSFSTQSISVFCDSDIAPHQVQLAQQIKYHASYVWDPGTMLAWYESIWWLYGIPLWLINFQVP